MRKEDGIGATVDHLHRTIYGALLAGERFQWMKHGSERRQVGPGSERRQVGHGSERRQVGRKPVGMGCGNGGAKGRTQTGVGTTAVRSHIYFTLNFHTSGIVHRNR